MKTMILATLAALSLGVGAASAQGLPGGNVYRVPQYGAGAFTRNNQSVFSWSPSDQTRAQSQVSPSGSGAGVHNVNSTSSAARGG